MQVACCNRTNFGQYAVKFQLSLGLSLESNCRHHAQAKHAWFQEQAQLHGMLASLTPMGHNGGRAEVNKTLVARYFPWTGFDIILNISGVC